MTKQNENIEQELGAPTFEERKEFLGSYVAVTGNQKIGEGEDEGYLIIDVINPKARIVAGGVPGIVHDMMMAIRYTRDRMQGTPIEECFDMPLAEIKDGVYLWASDGNFTVVEAFEQLKAKAEKKKPFTEEDKKNLEEINCPKGIKLNYITEDDCHSFTKDDFDRSIMAIHFCVDDIEGLTVHDGELLSEKLEELSQDSE